MLYLLKNLEGIQPNTLESMSFAAIDLEGNGVDISIDNGLLYVNGVASGQSATGVEDGDTLKLELTSSTIALATEYVVVRQQGIVQGIFSVSTISDQLANVRSEYFDLEPMEILPDSTWVPDALIEYGKLTSAMSPYDVHAISEPEGKSSSVRNILCDYHRDKVYLINPSTMEHFHTFEGYAGPISSADLYADGFRFLTLVAYKEENKIIGYDNIFEVLNIDSTEPVKLQAQGKALFILEKGASHIRRLIFDETDLSFVEDSIAYSEPILDFISGEYGVSVLHRNKLIDFASEEVSITPAYRYTYNPDTDTFLITHTTEGAYSYTEGVNGSRTATRVITTLDYLSIAIPVGDGFYVLGEKGSIKVRADHSFIPYDTLDYPTFSLEEFKDTVFSSRLYPTIPNRVQSVDLEPNPVDFGEVESSPIGTTVYSNTVNIGGLEEAVQVKLPPLPSAKIKLLKNGIEVPAPANVENGDTLQIEMEITQTYKSAFMYPVTIAGDTFIFKLLPIPGETLPRETSVSPAGTISTDDIEYTHSFNLRMPLIEDSIYVQTDKGILYKNGYEIGVGANFNRSDFLNVHLPYQVYGVEYVTLTFGENAFESIVAFNEQPWNPNEGETPAISFNLVSLGPIGTNFDDRREGDWIVPVQETIKTSPARVILSGAPYVDLEVPDIWNAQIYKNGVASGRQVSVSHGDEVEFEMTTTSTYDIQHLLPIIVPRVAQRYWNVYTEEDWYIEPFDLGLTDGHVITDYVVSNEITVSGLGSRVAVPIQVPHNTKLFINGGLVYGGNYTADRGGDLDYRGTIIADRVLGNIFIKNGDTIRLEGYPRPVYGTLQSYELIIGKTPGYWRVGTIDVQDEANAVSSHFAEVEVEPIEGVADVFNSAVEADLRLPPAVAKSTQAVKVTNPTLSIVSVSSASVKTIDPIEGLKLENSQVLSEPKESIISANVPVLQDGLVGMKLDIPLLKAEYFEGPLLLESNVVLSNNIKESLALHGNPSFGETFTYTNFKTEHPETIERTEGQVNNYPELKIELPRYNRFESSPYYGERFPIELRTYGRDPVLDFVDFDPSEFVVFKYAYVTIENTSQKTPGVYPIKPGVSYIRDSKVWDESNIPLVDPIFEVIARNVDPYMIPVWEKGGLNPTIGYDPIYLAVGRPDEVKMVKLSEKDPEPREVKAESTFEVTPRPKEVHMVKVSDKSTSSSPKVVSNKVLSVLPSRPTLAQASVTSMKSTISWNRVLRSESELNSKPTFLEVGSNGQISIGNTSESDLRQTFLTEQDAADNAEQVYGLASDVYTVVPYEDQFVWIRVIPCENMCYSCPDLGYIQGG